MDRPSTNPRSLRLPRQARPVARQGPSTGSAAGSHVAPSDWDDGTASCSAWGVPGDMCQSICSGGFGSIPEGLCQPTEPIYVWSQTGRPVPFS